MLAPSAAPILTPEEEQLLAEQAAAVPPPADGYNGGGTYNPNLDANYVPPPAEGAMPASTTTYPEGQPIEAAPVQNPVPEPVVYAPPPAQGASQYYGGADTTTPISGGGGNPDIVTTSYPSSGAPIETYTHVPTGAYGQGPDPTPQSTAMYSSTTIGNGSAYLPPNKGSASLYYGGDGPAANYQERAPLGDYGTATMGTGADISSTYPYARNAIDGGGIPAPSGSASPMIGDVTTTIHDQGRSRQQRGDFPGRDPYPSYAHERQNTSRGIKAGGEPFAIRRSEPVAPISEPASDIRRLPDSPGGSGEEYRGRFQPGQPASQAEIQAASGSLPSPIVPLGKPNEDMFWVGPSRSMPPAYIPPGSTMTGPPAVDEPGALDAAPEQLRGAGRWIGQNIIEPGMRMDPALANVTTNITRRATMTGREVREAENRDQRAAARVEKRGTGIAPYEPPITGAVEGYQSQGSAGATSTKNASILPSNLDAVDQAVRSVSGKFGLAPNYGWGVGDGTIPAPGQGRDEAAPSAANVLPSGARELGPGMYAPSTNPQTPDDWGGVTTRSLELGLRYPESRQSILDQTDRDIVANADWGVTDTQVQKRKGTDQIIGVFVGGNLVPVGEDVGEEEFRQLLIAGDAGTVSDRAGTDAVSEPATPPSASGTSTKTPAVTVTDVVPATGGGGSNSGGSGKQWVDYGNSGGGSSNGGGGYRSGGSWSDDFTPSRSSGRSSGSFGDDFEKDFTADDFMDQAKGDRKKATFMANAANKRRRSKRGTSTSSGTGAGFSFNRPNTPMRDSILAAIAESKATGRARKAAKN